MGTMLRDSAHDRAASAGLGVIPPEAFLSAYPDAIREAAETLRAIIKQAVPDAVERVRPGWRLIGFDVPLKRRLAYFAYIAPEPIHCHLGFEYGAAMADQQQRLEGAHLGLRQVRFLTFRPGDAIPAADCLELVREAARVAVLPREARSALALDRAIAPRDDDRR